MIDYVFNNSFALDQRMPHNFSLLLLQLLNYQRAAILLHFILSFLYFLTCNLIKCISSFCSQIVNNVKLKSNTECAFSPKKVTIYLKRHLPPAFYPKTLFMKSNCLTICKCLLNFKVIYYYHIHTHAIIWIFLELKKV